jgi:hypothetical protein
MGKITVTGTGVSTSGGIVWPVTLPPLPLMTGAVETAPDLAIRTDMDTGPPKVRMRTSAGLYKMQCEFLMTGTQLATFIEFWETTTYGGTEPFEWTHPRTDAVENMRFASPPQWSQVRGGASAAQLWRVGMELEMLP